MKLLSPDLTKKKFEIIITVYENCQEIKVVGEEPSYQEVIGALEIQKTMLIFDQSTYNREILNAQKDESHNKSKRGKDRKGSGI